MADKNTDLNRRTVLQTAGVATFGGFGLTRAAGKSSAKKNSLRLIEANITSEAELSDDIVQPQIDYPHKYIINSNGNLKFNHIISDDEKKLLKNRPSITFVNGKLQKSANILNPTEYDVFPTQTASGYRHASAVRLETPVTGENVVITSSPKNPHIKIGNEMTSLDPGNEYEFELETQSVKAKTETVTDKKIQDDRVPERLRSNVVESGTKEIDITPKILVRDRGQVEVLEDEQ